ncbi:MAG: hypothetical protein NT062_24325, partial [Proteobacteria bacterium]|nr:hypothetical protein [Pseudomonadota bacterium]
MKRIFLILVALAACGDDGAPAPTCTTVGAFDVGTDGVAAPLQAGANEARAGRLAAADLPPVPSGLITWKPGDFVLANAKVALVIEDVGDSDLYDPWGGRPVGLARVANGAMIEPNNFGELFVMTGRSTVVTDSVSVIADGSDGGPAIVRARGKLHPIPFLESLLGSVFSESWTDIDAAIDYELAPGAEVVTVRMRYASPRAKPTTLPTVMNALMYTKRTPVFQPTKGFDDSIDQAYVALVDEGATSWAYLPEGAFNGSLAASGFVGAFTPGFEMPACGTLDRVHARIVIGGLDATGKYLTRAMADVDGNFRLTVPATADVKLVAIRRGDVLVEQTIGAASTGQLVVPAHGSIHVTALEGGLPVPVRVQLRPASGQIVPKPPHAYGEPENPGDRLHVAFPTTGDVTLPAPPGDWDVIVSRGYEYELVEQTHAIAANTTTTMNVAIARAVDSTGMQCGDFHVHTSRSNDSNDDGKDKVAQAIADGLELPVRSDHEWVGDFSTEITALGAEKFAAGFSSIELTSMELWGHMGVFPLTADASKPNNGAPAWQRFPTAARPDTAFETLSPPAVFDAVR